MSYELNPAGEADWDTVGGEYLDNVCIHASAQDVISDLVEDKREWNPYLNEAFFKEYKAALETIVPDQLRDHAAQCAYFKGVRDALSRSRSEADAKAKAEADAKA